MRGNYIKTLGLAVLCFSFVALVPRASAQRVELLNLTNTVWSYSQENVDYLSSVPAFYETTFDASTWPTGQGLFGLETSGGTTYTDADGNPAPGEINSGGGGTQFNTAWTRNPPNTYFLRTTFNWSGTASGLILSGRLCVDDGTVIWVNGIEVYRYNVPDGAPTFDQDVGTANPAGEPNIVTFQVSGDGVVADGVNTIAMVNLQANPTGSSDVVMGLDLYGETAIIPSIDDPLLPEDAVVEEGRSHTLSVVASAVPAPTYQWYFGGIEITGATSSDYTITNMTTATAGAYFARVSNSAGSVDSRTATITFAADVTAPVLAGEPTILDDGTVSLPWSEEMDATVIDTFNVSVYPVGGDFFYDNLGIASAALADGTNWVLTTGNPAVPGQDYLLVMYGSSVSDLFGNLNADIFDLPVVNEVAGPVLENGSILADGSIELFFNEDMSDVIVAGDISVYPTGGDPVAGNLGVASAVVTDGSTLVLTTTGVAVAGESYSIRILVGAVSDVNANANEVQFDLDLATIITIVAGGSVWNYLDNGSDQGTAWQALAFDDSSWLSGPAQLGYANGPVTTTSFGPDSNNKYITTYFRATFNLTDASGITQLTLGLVRDDGAVVYINGTEVRRDNLPAAPAPILFNTLAGATDGAIGGADETTFFESDIPDPTSVLVTGENIIAVEIHQQSVTSSDTSFDLYLEGAGTFTSEAPVITTQPTPASITVEEGESATWSVEASGFPIPNISWELNGVPVANGNTITIDPARPSDAGTYVAVASNAGGSASSDPVTLTVNPDTVAPTLDSGLALRDRQSVLLTFSEGMGASAGDSGNYVIDLVGGGGALTITNVTVNGNEVTLEHAETRADSNYQVTVSNVGDAADTSNILVPNPTVIELDSEIEYIAADAVWSYLDNGTDQGTAWKETDFDDSLWAGGPAELGYGDDDEATVIGFGPDSANKFITTYFRHTFTLVDASQINALQGELTYDDGALVYLNGTEVFRINMTNGVPITYTDLAEGAGDYGLETFNIDPALLVTGDNVVAVEIHQGTLGSSDISMALALIGLTAEVLLPAEITATIDEAGDLILTWTGSGDLWVQETSELVDPASASVWTTLPGGPHISGVNVGPATGQRYFRLSDTP